MSESTFTERLRYRFDNYMSKGAAALIGGLGIFSLLIIILAGIVLVITGIAPEGEEKLGFFEAFWQSLMRTLDAGTMGGDSGWGFRIIMFVVTLGGVFIISGLIGVLTSGLESKIEELRKGRSRAIESNHTAILGWSSQIFTIISELVTANENQKDPCIVILGDKDKVEMEDEIRDMAGKTGKTRVVCRSGSPLDPANLVTVSIDTARSIIILAPEKENPDVDVIKTMLAITNNPKRKKSPYHVAAEIQDPRNLDVAKLVGREEVELVLASDLIARVIAQTCRQSGLSVVYTELLDFGGDEIYFTSSPQLTGKTYGECLFAYEDSAVMGMKTATGQIRLNPPMDTTVAAGDELIVISADDDTIKLSGKNDFGVNSGAIALKMPTPLNPETTLILGWNWKAPAIINELDAYVPPGSHVVVSADVENGGAEIDRLCTKLKNIAVEYRYEDTTDRRVLDALEVDKFGHIILLCYSDRHEAQQADARTLITLLHLRDIAEKKNVDLNIVSEMLDIRNRSLAEVTRADDFIVSDNLISLMLTQVSENKHLNSVFKDLFSPEGSEIYLKPVDNYIRPGVEVNFYTLLEAARLKGETAIGYRLQRLEADASAGYGVAVNPDKSHMVTFSAEDRIIVLAES